MTDADARGSILSAEELAEIRAEHRDVAGSCEACNEFWPCDASQLLVHVKARERLYRFTANEVERVKKALESFESDLSLGGDSLAVGYVAEKVAARLKAYDEDAAAQADEQAQMGADRDSAITESRTALKALAQADAARAEWQRSAESYLAMAQNAKAAVAQADAERLDLEKRIRQLLWLNHGHSSIVYGDDGEMQCNDTHQNGETHAIGPLDFKRQALPFLASAICSLLRFEQRERAAQAERITYLETALHEITGFPKEAVTAKGLAKYRGDIARAALVASRSPAPALERIPSFNGEDGDDARVMFWVEQGAHDWHVMYRTGVAAHPKAAICTASEQVCRVRARVLNELFEKAASRSPAQEQPMTRAQHADELARDMVAGYECPATCADTKRSTQTPEKDKS